MTGLYVPAKRWRSIQATKFGLSTRGIAHRLYTNKRRTLTYPPGTLRLNKRVILVPI